MAGHELLADLAFSATAIAWRGPAPFVFMRIPEHFTGEVRYAARLASYGWGVVPVSATIAGTAFTTSLFPRSGGYLLPVKTAVQRATGVTVGDSAAVTIRIYATTAVTK